MATILLSTEMLNLILELINLDVQLDCLVKTVCYYQQGLLQKGYNRCRECSYWREGGSRSVM